MEELENNARLPSFQKGAFFHAVLLEAVPDAVLFMQQQKYKRIDAFSHFSYKNKKIILGIKFL
ncbi:MAG: hypothetical protein MRZ82_03935 [Firmicutes bacterium]|nr:hypothetical protein [Bacillota bacterium]